MGVASKTEHWWSTLESNLSPYVQEFPHSFAPYRRKGNKIVGLLRNPHCYRTPNRLDCILFARI